LPFGQVNVRPLQRHDLAAPQSSLASKQGTPKSTSSFYDFEEYERLVEISQTDPATHLAVFATA
jgi:hypothetical protein